MSKKVITGLVIAALAIPALWFGVSAYNDYRVKNCTPQQDVSVQNTNAT